MVYGSFGTVLGMILVIVPVIIYQYDNVTPPLGHNWTSPRYAIVCLILGMIGGLLMVPSSTTSSSTTTTTSSVTTNASAVDIESNGGIWHNTRHQKWFCGGGYRWVGGLLGGGLASGLAYLASWRIAQESSNDIVDLPLILFCCVPGLIVYSLIHQCSDWTFPPPPSPPPQSSSSSSRQNQHYNDYQWIPSVDETRITTGGGGGSGGGTIGTIRTSNASSRGGGRTGNKNKVRGSN